MSDFDVDLQRVQRAAALEEQQREVRRRALPCFEAAAAGDRAAAVDACEAVRAFDDCEFSRSSIFDDKRACPRMLESYDYDRAKRLLSAAGVPSRVLSLILAARAGHRDAGGNRCQPTPLIDTDALRVTKAFATGEEVTIQLDGGGRVALVGDESLLVLAGPPGVGKSLAAAVPLERNTGVYVTAPDLAQLDGPAEKCKSVDWLVIDDLGTEHVGGGGFAISRLVGVIVARFEERLPTIVTTNLVRPDFTSRYGDRIEDRLHGGGRYVALVGESLRRRVDPDTLAARKCALGRGDARREATERPTEARRFTHYQQPMVNRSPSPTGTKVKL